MVWLTDYSSDLIIEKDISNETHHVASFSKRATVIVPAGSQLVGKPGDIISSTGSASALAVVIITGCGPKNDDDGRGPKILSVLLPDSLTTQKEAIAHLVIQTFVGFYPTFEITLLQPNPSVTMPRAQQKLYTDLETWAHGLGADSVGRHPRDFTTNGGFKVTVTAVNAMKSDNLASMPPPLTPKRKRGAGAASSTYIARSA